MSYCSIISFVAAMTFSFYAHAFGNCDNIFEDKLDLEEKIKREIVSRAPAKYHGIAKSVRLRLVALEQMPFLMPRAMERHKERLIVFPMEFAKFACQVSLATALVVDDVGEEEFDRAALSAATCIDTGKHRAKCYVEFGNELENRYYAAFYDKPLSFQKTAEALFHAAFWSIIRHEYYHHYSGYLSRDPEAGIHRVEEEFLADFYAITDAMQSGLPATAIFYFFYGVSAVEAQQIRPNVQEYESGFCRATNVTNITKAIGLIPTILIDAAWGGGVRFSLNSPGSAREYINSFMDWPEPVLENGSCSYIDAALLKKVFAETRQIASRMARDLDILFASDENVDDKIVGSLIYDFSEMTRSFEYLRGVSSKILAILLSRWRVNGQDVSRHMERVETIINNDRISGDIQSDDYGRIIMSYALALLQERDDLPAPIRLERSAAMLDRALQYNPRLTDAWTNLGLIAFMQGDCTAAARHIRMSIATRNQDDKKGLETATSLEKIFGVLSENPERCREEGKRSHLYKGL